MKAFLLVLLSVLSWSALQAQAVMVFEADLSGDQEVPPVTSLASGSAELTLNDTQTELAILISIVDLDLDGNQTSGVDGDNVGAAHIHRAPAGANGDVVFGFISPNNDLNNDLVIDAAAGTIFSVWDLGEGNAGTTLADELPSLLNEGLYINIHTPSFPGGELRGQITAVAIPEPAALGLFVVGLFGLGLSATAGLRRA
ncbi:CHRD domain-containing protein [Nitrococcus mobilis]|uniref:CHRD domain-containing protein n=1 Tax=Nitrococcus mobilis Nb-231 TaxID=314278 RepID=A4BLE1_9GAMM|nr:PEP-CTERM domain protein [Nitrococcus mobilis]EAR23129.1 hypothetical protein NB231_14953 [Nitrococcus mobilis Nb-231]